MGVCIVILQNETDWQTDKYTHNHKHKASKQPKAWS